MTRPRYETATDRRNEVSAISRFAALIDGMTVEKLPNGHRADYLAVRPDSKRAYIEVKTRTCPSTQYQTYHVSKDKLTSLVSLAETEGVTPLLLVQWSDRVGYIGVTKYLDNATFTQGGRWDRNDPYDVETMAEVDIRLFKFL